MGSVACPVELIDDSDDNIVIDALGVYPMAASVAGRRWRRILDDATGGSSSDVKSTISHLGSVIFNRTAIACITSDERNERSSIDGESGSISSACRRR